MQIRTAYGIFALLVALLLITSSVTVYYYYEYQGVVFTDRTHVGELQASIARYNSLAANFTALAHSSASENSSAFKLVATFGELSHQFNLTIYLLTSTISNLNTSSAAYARASAQLSGIWRNYLGLLTEYQGTLATLKSYTTVSFPVQEHYTASILINFGNGTRIWYNDTIIQPGWNFYIGTLIVTNGRVNATWYPQYGEHFITGVEGVFNNPSKNQAWENWVYNSTKGWQGNLPVGADNQIMFKGSILAWSYCPYDPSTYLYTCAAP